MFTLNSTEDNCFDSANLSATNVTQNSPSPGINNSSDWIFIGLFSVSLFFVCGGIVGNAIIIATVRGKLCQYRSHGIHLTALAVADIKLLIVNLFNHRFVWNAVGTDLRGISAAGCKVFAFTKSGTKLCSTYFVILLCIERFIGVWFPLKAKQFTTRRIAVRIVVAVFVTAYVLAFLATVLGKVQDGKCVYDTGPTNGHLHKLFNAIILALSSLIPTVVLLCLTSLTIVKLFYRRSVRRRLGFLFVKDDLYRTTSVIMSICFAYLLLVSSFTGSVWILMLYGFNVITSTAMWVGVFLEILVACENLNSALNISYMDILVLAFVAPYVQFSDVYVHQMLLPQMIQ